MCMFCKSLFVLLLLVIVWSVLLRFTDSDYPPLVFSNSSHSCGDKNQMPIFFTSVSYNASRYHVTQVDFLKLFFTTCIIACNWILRSHDGTMILMNTRENKYYDDRHFGTDPLNALSVSHIPIMHHCM